jgi:hypothetical protein
MIIACHPPGPPETSSGRTELEVALDEVGEFAQEAEPDFGLAPMTCCRLDEVGELAQQR